MDYNDPNADPTIDPLTGKPKTKPATTAGAGFASLASTPGTPDTTPYGNSPVLYATPGDAAPAAPATPAPLAGPTLDGNPNPPEAPGPMSFLPGSQYNTTQAGLSTQLMNRALTAAPDTSTSQAAAATPDPGDTTPPRATFPDNPANPGAPLSPTAPPNPQQPGPAPTTPSTPDPTDIAGNVAAWMKSNNPQGHTDASYWIKRITETGGLRADNLAYWLDRFREAPGTHQEGPPAGGPGDVPIVPPTSAPVPTPGTPALPSQTNPDGSQPVGAGTRDPRWKDLYDQLLKRSQQSLNVDPNDPAIKAQVDAAGAQANVERVKQMQAAAERGGAYATGATANDARMTGETVQLQQAGLQAQLMSREIDARRTEIAQALSSMQGILTVDEQSRLQQEDQALQARQQDLANAQAQIQNAFNSRQQDETERQNAWYRMFQDRGWESDLAQTNWQNEHSIYG